MDGFTNQLGVDQSRVVASASFVRALLPPFYSPTVGIIGGSGLSTIENLITSFNSDRERLTLSFDQIPGFQIPSVQGHVGKLIFGTLHTESKKINAVLMNGRSHFYEGSDPKITTFPIRVLGALGVETLIVTNAAGGLNKAFKTGDIMIINDHISFPSLSGSFNPLIGPLRFSQSSQAEQRFLALSDAYDFDLRKAAWQAWKRMSSSFEQNDPKELDGEVEKRGRNLQEGVYAFVAGPTYETRAESRLLLSLGADVVGMSTVPEVIVARHIGIRLLGLSLVTNMVVLEKVPRGNEILDKKNSSYNISDGKANHAEVLEAGKTASDIVKSLIINIADIHLK